MDNKKQDYYDRRRKDTELMNKINMKMNERYNKNNIHFNRINDDEIQKHGVDLVMLYNNALIRVDEKCAVRYYNLNLNTFCFEISANNNIDNCGWFCENPFYISSHYCLIWVRANDSELNKITELRWLLVSKKAVWKVLKENCVFDAKTAIYKVKNYGKIDEKGRMVYVVNKDIKIMWSKNIFPEQPINIIIHRRLLEQISELSEIST